jgi:gamma-glutamylcyclotransferase (GGCT)/AIG2-like uncharacterized protein YtfP
MKAGYRLTTDAVRPSAVFVYGTLMPGEERWPFIEEHVVAARQATVAGQLFDTGRGYPCALFDRPGTIPGAVIELDPARVDELLMLLDEIEGVEIGLYERVVVTTDANEPVWSYAWRDVLDGLVRIVRW